MTREEMLKKLDDDLRFVRLEAANARKTGEYVSYWQGKLEALDTTRAWLVQWEEPVIETKPRNATVCEVHWVDNEGRPQVKTFAPPVVLDEQQELTLFFVSEKKASYFDSLRSIKQARR